MKTKHPGPPRINIITLGCSKNTVDSEVLLGQLQAGGFDAAHEAADGTADTVVINTCGFIENARKESIDTILYYAREKEAGRIRRLYVTGCLSERYMPELQREIPDVDRYFGTRHLPQLLETLGADYRHELIGERRTVTPTHYAYLKISEGCDRPCSFCAIPVMRGRHVSRPMDDLVAEARHLARNGTKELLVIAQDSTFYGLDLYKERRLATLLGRLADVEGIQWIRLHYAFPTGFPRDVLEVMRDRPNICRYIDMPLQHISDRILQSMRRGSGRDTTLRLLDTIRTTVPGVALRTTLIAGYPGETDAEHRELLRFVETAGFERLGVFAYSHEEQTHAHTLADDVPADVKEARVAALMQAQQEQSRKVNESRVGQTLRVLFDRKEGASFVGRTEWDSPEVDNEVLVEATGRYVRTGDFADVRIDAAEDFDLFGTVV